MAHDVKIRFRSYLPGGGYDSSGNPKQGKTRVVGQVAVTSYAGGSGEQLGAQDVGLTAIDSMQLRVADENSGALSGSVAFLRGVTYTSSTGHFYLIKTDADGSITNASLAATESLEFEAFGDSAHDVELT